MSMQVNDKTDIIFIIVGELMLMTSTQQISPVSEKLVLMSQYPDVDARGTQRYSHLVYQSESHPEAERDPAMAIRYIQKRASDEYLRPPLCACS